MWTWRQERDSPSNLVMVPFKVSFSVFSSSFAGNGLIDFLLHLQIYPSTSRRAGTISSARRKSDSGEILFPSATARRRRKNANELGRGGRDRRVFQFFAHDIPPTSLPVSCYFLAQLCHPFLFDRLIRTCEQRERERRRRAKRV